MKLPRGLGRSAALVSILVLGCGGGTPPKTQGAGGEGGDTGDETGGSGGSAAGGTGGSAGNVGSGGKGGTSGSGGSGATGGSAGSGSETGGAGGSATPDAGANDPGSSDAGPATSDGGSPIPITGLGPWTGKDNVPPSRVPPGNLKPEQVPMFVSLGFDDNPYDEGVNWAVGVFNALTNPGKGQAATYDGTKARATFYDSSVYSSAAGSWKASYMAGFENGDHTINHYHGAAADGGMNFSVAGWTKEIQGCIDFLTGGSVGMKRQDIWGFRTPFLQYNANTFPAVKALNFQYDCSIEEGHQEDMDGTNYWWPYTLDSGSPGNATHPRLTPITTWPTALWEMPAYRVIVPPDEVAMDYGVPPGLRAKLQKLHPDGVGIKQGKITGLDYNLWYDYLLSKAEFVATLKYTLDQHRKGNRTPMLFGMHTAIYTTHEAMTTATVPERKAAVVEFLAYANKFPDVRIVTTKAVLDWIRNPVPLQ